MITKVVEMRPHEFMGNGNELVKGTFIYLTVTKENGSMETRRVFVAEDRMAEWAYIPAVGDNVLVL